MKKITLSLTISLLLVIMIFSSVTADLPGSGWWSSFYTQNISNNEGEITMYAYNKNNGDIIGSDLFVIQPDKALVYDPGKIPNYPPGNIIGFDQSLSPGFIGSVVLSSTIESASVVQIANYKNGSVGGSGRASALYQGVSSTATTLRAPTIKHNYSGATTTLYIQAAGAEAVVTVTYRMANGGEYVDVQTIPENRTYIFDPAAVNVPSTGCGGGTLVSACYGSATITSDNPIAGVLLEHPHSGTPVNFLQAMRLLTPEDESTIIYVPSVKNDFCGGSGCGVAGAVVMNVGNQPTNVTITLTVTKLGINAGPGVNIGDVFTANATIQPGENYNFSKWRNNLGGLPQGTLAAAVIVSTDGVPLVGSSNDAKTQPNFPGEAKVKYIALPDELATPVAYAPMVKEMLGIFTGGVTVQNVGTQEDTIIIEYHQYGSDNVCILTSKSLIPVGGAAETNYVSVSGDRRFNLSGNCTSFDQLAGKEYSVKAYTSGSQNIVMMITQNTPNGTLDISRYEGVNVSP